MGSDPPALLGGHVAVSLRGSETTEAISQGIEKDEIAALSSVARNDKTSIATQFQGTRG